MHTPTDNITQTLPSSNKLEFLAKNEPMKFYFLIDGAKFETSIEIKIDISYYNSYSGLNVQHSFKVTKSEVINTDIFHKLAYKAIIDDNNFNYDITTKLKDDVIIDMSIKYQCLLLQI